MSMSLKYSKNIHSYSQGSCSCSRVHFVASLRQACEDENDKYQLVHIANVDLKDVEVKLKELLEVQQL